MKKYIITLLLSCVSVIGIAQVANEVPGLIGSWNGKLKVGANSLTLVFHFALQGVFIVRLHHNQ